MSLLRKVRVLVGALVHKPFMPKPEKVDLHDKLEQSPQGTTQHDSTGLEAQPSQAEDTERVADLIVRQQQEE